MPNVDPIVFLVLAVIAFGIALIYLARLSNQKNQALRAAGRDRRLGTFHGLHEALNGHFFGSLAKWEASLGKFLAFAVIIFVVSFLGFAAYAVIKNAI